MSAPFDDEVFVDLIAEVDRDALVEAAWETFVSKCVSRGLLRSG